MWQAFLPWAEGKRQENEEQTSENQSGSGPPHTGHRPGELVVKRDGVVTGQEGQDGLVEDQDGDEDQDTCTRRRRGGRGQQRVCVSVVQSVRI